MSIEDTDTPNIDDSQFRAVDAARLFQPERMTHPPRILMLYGSLRERSYSRLLTEEAARAQIATLKPGAEIVKIKLEILLKLM